ncbi:MAG TPA: DUF3142 domain-containing protein [bacterium]|nr:DUF3142 domain-containing protein [bacterium]
MRRVQYAFLLPAACAALASVSCTRPVPRAAGPISQEVYVWQRSWDGAVQESINMMPSQVSGLAVLAAEISWDKGRLRSVMVPCDYPALKKSGLQVGLALRIGPYPGPFTEDGEPARTIAGLAAKIMARAKDSGLNVQELQIDFDCADGKLDGYRSWLAAIRQKTGPTPLVITALPSWLKPPAILPAHRDGARPPWASILHDLFPGFGPWNCADGAGVELVDAGF